MRALPRSFIFYCLAVVLAACRPTVAARDTTKTPTAEKVSFCDLLTHMSDYSGRVVVVTVRISSFKEGSVLWSPECSEKGVGLLIENESGPGIAELSGRISPHPYYAQHPLVATLTGVLDMNYYDKVRHRKRAIFKVIAARDIRQPTERELLH